MPSRARRANHAHRLHLQELPPCRVGLFLLISGPRCGNAALSTRGLREYSVFGAAGMCGESGGTTFNQVKISSAGVPA